MIGSLRRPALSSLYPVRQSAAHPQRFGLGMVRTSGTSSAAQGARGETSHLRLKTCTTLGWCFGTSHPRGRAPSAPRPGLARRGRGWWRRRDGRGHPGLSFLLIDVDRRGSARSCPQLTLRQAQIRLPRRSRGPSVYGRPQGCKRFLPVGHGGAVEFFRVSGLLMQQCSLRALMVSSRNGSKTHLRGLSLREGHWFSYS